MASPDPILVYLFTLAMGECYFSIPARPDSRFEMVKNVLYKEWDFNRRTTFVCKLVAPVLVDPTDTLAARMHENVARIDKIGTANANERVENVVTNQEAIHYVVLADQNWDEFKRTLKEKVESGGDDETMGQRKEANEAASVDERGEVAKAVRGRSAPSKTSKPDEQKKRQDSHGADVVYNWRPLRNWPPPFEAYCSLFVEFVQKLEAGPALDKFDEPEELNAAHRIVSCATAIHLGETSLRAGLFRTVLFQGAPGECFEDQPVTFGDKLYKSDVHRICVAGKIIVDGSPVTNVPCEIAEVKPETGGDCAALFQAENSYLAAFSSENSKATAIRNACCCPALLMAVTGPSITFAGAVFAHVPICQRLTHELFLGPLIYEDMDGAIRRVAHLVDSLNDVRRKLDAFYRDLEPASSSFIGPTHTTFGIGGSTHKLEYTARLDPDAEGRNKDKAAFKAWARPEVGEGEPFEVVVKFARQYGKRGHELLAPPLEKGKTVAVTETPRARAPQLYYCEKLEALGGLFMIVMEHVAHSPDAPLPANARQQLKSALDVLHDEKLVFGDLRHANLLVAEGGEVVLIDFDWCGLQGVARYPATLNTTDIDWPDGVAAGALITEDHDRAMLASID